MIKKLLSLLLLLLVLAFLSADRLLQWYVQQSASGALNTPVSVSDVRVDVLQGRLNIDFVQVDNLPGFKAPHLAKLDHLNLEIDRVDDHLLVADRLVFDGLSFHLEQDQNRVNLIQWFQTLEQGIPSTSSGSTQTGKHASKWRVAIKEVSFINTQVSVDSEFLVDALSVPDTQVRDLGGAHGVEADQLGAELARIVLSRAQRVLEERGLRFAEDQIKASLRKQLEKELGGLEDQLGDKAKSLFKKLGL